MSHQTPKTSSIAEYRLELHQDPLGNGKWGFVDSTGKKVIEDIYDDATEFYYTLGQSGMRYYRSHALAFKESQWRMIDNKGKEVYTFHNTYSSMSILPKELLAVGIKTDSEQIRFGVINYNEEEVIKCQYQYVKSYGGDWIVCNNLIGSEIVDRDSISSQGIGEWGHYDEDGNPIDYTKYAIESTIYSITGKVLCEPVIIKGTIDTIRPDGYHYREIIPDTFRASMGFAVAKDIGGKLSFINFLGNPICPPIYDRYSAIYYGHAVVWRGNHCGLLNRQGVEVLDLVFDSIEQLSSDKLLIVVLEGKKYIFNIDSNSLSSI